MADLKALVARINKDTRKSAENLVSVENQVSAIMAEWAPHTGECRDEQELVAAEEAVVIPLLQTIVDEAVRLHLTAFESVRSGLAAAYEGVIRPRNLRAPWQRVLAATSWREKEGEKPSDREKRHRKHYAKAVPVLEKDLTRLIVSKAAEEEKASYGMPTACHVQAGEYIAQYVGRGKWRVGLK